MDNQQKFEIIKNANADKLGTLDYEGFIGLDQNGLNIVLNLFGRISELNKRGRLNALWREANLP
eukprot:3240039-Prorocentrum_lima.AAC.1